MCQRKKMVVLEKASLRQVMKIVQMIVLMKEPLATVFYLHLFHKINSSNKFNHVLLAYIHNG